ncbi:hypothetical protein F5Y16DRAFT_135267 [Xylariaceae sp. FL0255]|nr:hypothetical protein F5Y16DRAFT_135267 [Xylariaceae sp. FL0255]
MASEITAHSIDDLNGAAGWEHVRPQRREGTRLLHPHLHVGTMASAWWSSHLGLGYYMDYTRGGCVQTEDQAIYLPLGCIHSTYTLQGGLTPGIEFSTIECLEPAAKIWDINSERARLCGNDCYPLLEAVIMGLRSGRSDRLLKSMELLCPKYKRVCKLNPVIWSKVRKELPRNCSECGKLWVNH